MGCFDAICGWCCCCCGRNRYHKADSHLQPLNIFPTRHGASLEELLERSRRARDDLLKRLGGLEQLQLTQPSSPGFGERPKWPAQQQSFKLVRRPHGTVLLVSDGLSDPFDDVTLGEFLARTVIGVQVSACRSRARSRVLLWQRDKAI